MKALVIPVDGPLFEVDLADEGSNLAALQGMVGGDIEAVPIPGFIAGADYATSYVNEEGSYLEDCRPNMRATDFFVPGLGIHYGTVIRGALVLCGFDYHTGTHKDLPASVAARARLIERESSTTTNQ